MSQMDNHSTVICQVFKEQDLTRGAESLCVCVCVCVLTAEPLMMSLPVYRARHGALHEEGGGGSLLGV